MCLINKGGNIESSLYLVGDKGSIKIGGNSLNKMIYQFCSGLPTTTKDDICVCLLYTSDAADDLLCVDLGGRRIIKKKNKYKQNKCFLK